MVKRAAHAVAAAAAICWPSALVAQSAPPHDATVQRHDGFYLRVGVGLGYSRVRSEGHDIDTTFDELGPALELLVGGTPARGLAIGGGQTWGGVDHTVGVLGPFVDYFPDDGGGVHVGGMAGIGVARGVPNARESPPNLDFGASIWAGYAFWLTDQLSLGLIGRFIYALDKKYDPVLDEAGTSYQLLITALYH